ncbi:hypothetical protein [Idiomarina aminovorans]|uniref:hypothetical protein n=1 Tax=Idiomarina aminovorans TaxID=2914829 RepID=UPI002004429C|nr:hypothetical protein [Idiomarina sp. ATCH4]MCK7458475.1 hypothetical protein [Idiomarina sp. ATCH4]
MKDVQSEVYYVVFTDRQTGLVGAKNYVDYETAAEEVKLMLARKGYAYVKITDETPFTSFDGRTHRGF